ncbi:MAG: hypothetical protein AAFQ07_08895 [Chloroflexota bacterium]
MPTDINVGQRIVIVGSGGSGKSTLAYALATCLKIPHISLDAMFWEADWHAVTDAVFHPRIEKALANAESQSGGWIVDGDYRGSGNIVFPNTSTMIWLDYALWRIAWRISRRSIQQILGGELLHGGNKQTWQAAFFGNGALVPYVLRTHTEVRARYLRLIEDNMYPKMKIVRVQRPTETTQLLKQIGC